jgi:MtrB/PioB family decaheme-associated outer membrane protein
MKTRKAKMQLSVLALAVQSALVAMYAMPALADDEDVAALKTPVNYLEVGVSGTTETSAKFGEYTGLNKSGSNLIGNFSVRGGDAYSEGDGTTRWVIKGDDLGLTSRSFTTSYSKQGSWNIGVGYDELQHNYTNTYQTPYYGNMGGNYFVLAPGFGTVSTAANGTNPTGTDALNATQLSALLPVEVYTSRKNSSFTMGGNLNAEWSVKFDINHLDQTGAKLMAFGSMAGAGASGEVVSILPNPTNYTTDNINLALNWIGEKGHVTTAYFGSFFRDGYDRVDFQTFIGANNMQTMSTPPGNDFHQLSVNGGYVFTSDTKLTAGYSAGRNTQNDNYAVDSISMVSAAPRTSLDGLVVNTHADVKLTNQASRDLALSAGARFDERDNKTQSYFYNFNALDGQVNHQAIFPNTPYSNRKVLSELAGDYRINPDQHLHMSFEHEDIKRWCDQYAVSTGVAPGASGYYPAGTNCVVATSSKEDKLGAAYKLRLSTDTNMHLGYSIAKRTTESDPNAITARIGTNGNPNLTATPLIMGLNAGDFVGFYPFFDATRLQQMLKAGVNWQASENFSLGVLGRYTDDKYEDSTYGVQNGNSWSLNLDSTYAYSETSSVSIYATQQHRERDVTDLQRSPTSANQAASATAVAIPAGASWTDHLKDDETTIGIGGRQNGLIGSKLELTEDLTYSMGNTGYGTQLNYSTTTTGGLTCSDSHILSCGDLPVMKNTMIQFKLIGKYKIDKSSKFALGYTFQQLESSDYYYNGLQYGYTSNSMMPTNMQAPNYTVNVISAAYSFIF